MADSLKRRKITKEEYSEIIETLTPSEYQLYEEMVKGYRTSEAAKRLKLKKSTVDSYLKVIYKKLNIHSMVEMIITYGPIYNVMNTDELE